MNNNINEIIIELIFCFQNGKSLIESELSSKQKKISLLYEKYTYIKGLLKRNTIMKYVKKDMKLLQNVYWNMKFKGMKKF